jgi:hypothetical protein
MDDLQELVAVMKNSLTMLGHTFDTLGEQTAHVATLPNVVENAHQVSTCQVEMCRRPLNHDTFPAHPITAATRCRRPAT